MTLSDGRLLLIPGDGYSPVAETRAEWVFETRPILAADLESGTVDTLADLPHLRRWYGSRGASPGPVLVKGTAGGFADGFAWSRADEREVRWYDGSGRLEQVARWEEEPVQTTVAWRRRFAREYEEVSRSRGIEEPVVADALVQLEEELDRYEGPVPYWSYLHVDRLGNAWVGEYTPFWRTPERWRVLTRDGILIGWVRTSGVVAILDITDDRILAVRHDEFDVPAVEDDRTDQAVVRTGRTIRIRSDSIRVSARARWPRWQVHMASLGYDYPGDIGIPDHRIYGRDPGVRRFLVHVVDAHGQRWRDLLRFRDLLRQDPELATTYQVVKERAASRYPTGVRGKYTSLVSSAVDHS